ncbi:MAG: MFS transporter [Candidatus Marinamargulisbacteria bacterium]
MITNYYHLLTQSRFFIFSISGIFFSAPGQTFLISLTIPTVCNVLSLSPLDFAKNYSMATLLASLMLPFIGKKIDVWTPQKTVLLNAFGFAASLVLFAISPNQIGLFLSLLFMRLFGQGALTLTATSHTIKQWSTHRGSALSLTQLGYPLSEFVFPSLFFLLIQHIGFQWTFIVFSISCLTLYLPLSFFGLHGTIRGSGKKSSNTPEDASLHTVLRDPYFPVYLLLSSIPPIMMTAAFYFQLTIFSNQGWPLSAIPMAIFGYALIKFLTTLVVGPLIDRWGVIPPLFILTFSIGLATMLLTIQGTSLIAYGYYALYGLGIGASAATMSYLWAHLYGASCIGQIKGVIAIVRNGGTALSPLLFSVLLYTLHVPLNQLFLISGGVIMLMSFIPLIMARIDSRLRR